MHVNSFDKGFSSASVLLINIIDMFESRSFASITVFFLALSLLLVK